MDKPIPSAEDIRAALAPLSMKQLDELERLSGVPATTIYKIKRGETVNPGIETLGKFMPFVPQLLAAASALPPAQPEPTHAPG
jgi:hypothetical protein